MQKYLKPEKSFPAVSIKRKSVRKKKGKNSSSPILDYIRKLSGPDFMKSLTDQALLNQFHRENKQEAFTQLVKRYGPIVLGLCYRMLRQDQDVEDAFQATFTILAKKTANLRNPDRLVSWLYGVALRTALHLKSKKALRQQKESVVAREQEDSKIGFDEEWVNILDQEVNKLPEKYKTPILLCYFQGLSHHQAGMKLGCPRETITTRLNRACKKLKHQFEKQGITSLTSFPLALLLSIQCLESKASDLSQGIEKGLEITKKGVVFKGTISKRVMQLYKGVLRDMFLIKIKPAFVLLLLAGILALGTGSILLPDRAAGQIIIKDKQSATSQFVAAQKKSSDQRKSVLDDYPPVVVKTFPVSGKNDVDAKNLKQIRINFSEKMKPGSFSIVQQSVKLFRKSMARSDLTPPVELV